MRVSENMKTLSLFKDLNRTMGRMLKTQNDLTTSTRIHRPSDDPGGTARLLSLKSYVNRNERYQKNVEDGVNWMVATESTLNDVLDTITETDSVLMQAGNDTLGEDERKILAGQMQEMLQYIVSLANQKFADRYLFGGTNNDTSPFTMSDEIEDESFTAAHDAAVALQNVGIRSGSMTVTTADGLTEFTEGTDYTIDYDDGEITVLGSGSMADSTNYLISYDTEKLSSVTLNPDGVDGTLMRRIDEGITLQINVTASSIFTDTGGLIDVIQQAIVALHRNDKSSISNIRSQLDNCLNRSTSVQGEVGSKIGRLEFQRERLSMNRVNLEGLISAIEDTDVASAVIQLQKDQYVYQAALQVGADLIQMSLLNYLK